MSVYDPNFIDLSNSVISSPANSIYNTGIAVANNIIYAIRNSIGVATYNATTGAIINNNFIPNTTDASFSQIYYYKDVLYIGKYANGFITRFNATTGNQIGANDFINVGASILGGVAFYYDKIFVLISAGTKRVRVYNLVDGSLFNNTYITHTNTSNLSFGLAVNRAKNYLYISDDSNGGGIADILVYDISNATTSGTTANVVTSLTGVVTTLNQIYSMVYRGNILYVGQPDKVVAFNANTMATLASSPIVRTNDVSGRYISIATEGNYFGDSYLYTLSFNTNKIGKFSLPNAPIDSPSVLGLSVYNNTIYATRSLVNSQSGIITYNATTGCLIDDSFISVSNNEFLHNYYYNNVLYLTPQNDPNGGITSTYNATTGTLISNNFINRGAGNSAGMAFLGNLLFAAERTNGKVAIYNASTGGAALNSNYITGLTTSISGIALNPDTNYLYILHESTGNVSLYDISNASVSNSTARLIRSDFITGLTLNGLTRPWQIIYRGNVLYISAPDRVVSYSATTGDPINGSANPFVPINDISGYYGVIACDNSIYSNAYLYTGSLYTNEIRRYSVPNLPIICFKEDTRILTDKGYKNIQDLRKGVLVKTSSNGYKAIHMIGKKVIRHIASQERIKDQLYRCSKNQFPELWDDLFITGRHSILVDGFSSEVERNKTEEVNKGIFVTEGKYRVPACVHGKTSVYETPGEYTVYHFALENYDVEENFGVYANGLLVESCSILVMNVLCDLKSYNLITERLIEDKETFSYMTGKIQLLNDEVAGIE